MRYLWFLLIFILGFDAFAQGQVIIPSTNALSLAPPANDASLTFLSNLFGVVDGVLAGTGSQLFSRMMAVFNSAILALGSIVFTYVLLMGTMHTAHEGEFLGRQWSSILIPLRTTFGLALLVPKASGYCIVQIFVMWVVVQGVGAADKIWDSALDYLSQGGKIVQQQLDSSAVTSDTNPKDGSSKANPAYKAGINMLAGQVCMLGLENRLRTVQKNLRDNPNSSCGDSNSEYSEFCNISIPDFLGTFDTSSAILSDINYSLPMPNFKTTDYFYLLNGICGTIKWHNDPDENTNTARLVAVQTMYSFLANVAYTMINNDPKFSNTSSTTPATDWAVNQFGVPYQSDGSTPCSPTSPDGCSSWGPIGSGTVLFTGNEFLNGVLAYTGTMAPILNYNLQKKSDDHTKATNFIASAKQNGWMFAGSYFFNLVNLSGSAAAPSGSTSIDSSSGLEVSTDPISDPAGLVNRQCTSDKKSFCWLMYTSQQVTDVKNDILNLIQDPNSTNLQIDRNFNKSIGYITSKTTNGLSTMSGSSTVYGFAGNSYFFQLKGQQSASGTISFNPVIPLTLQSYQVPELGFGCRGFLCIPGAIGDILMAVVKVIMDFVSIIMNTIMNAVLQLLLVQPLRITVIPLLNHAIQTLGDINNNPIVNLANMGAYFIQTTMTFWLNLAMVGAIVALPFPGAAALGIAISIIMGLLTPILASWFAYFMSVGFTTAYYIPMLPYMIFIFGAIGWLFAVVESMIAAPIVALVMTTPEGEGVVGKGEHGLMILLNVFLRPSLMVLGFMSSIAISYVSIWVLNATFSQGAQFLQLSADMSAGSYFNINNQSATIAGLDWSQFPWAQIYGTMFYVTIYISMYVTLVQKAFTLIYNVPDKIMRWIGGTQESYGQETAEWVKGTEQQIEKFGEKTAGGASAALGGYGKGITEALKAKSDADKAKKDDQSGQATPTPGPGPGPGPGA